MTIFIREWKMQLSGYSRNIKNFLWFNFVWNLGLGMFGLVYNLYIKALGYSQTMVGDIVGMTAMAAAIVIIPAGILNDRYGAKKLIVTGLLLAVGALSVRALISQESGLLLSAFAGGMSLALVSATIIPYLANHSTPEQRVHLFSLNMALVMAASVAGNVTGGLLTDILEFHAGFTEVQSLRITLLVGVVLAALGLIPVLALKNTKREFQPKARLNLREAWKEHRTSFQVIGLFAILGLLSSMAGGMVVPYLNVYFEDRFEASKTVIGIIVSLGQGATALAFLIGPVMAQKFGETRSVVLLQLSSIPFLLITAYSTNLWIASGGYLFRQALMNAANPFYHTVKMKYVDRSLRGLASSSGEAVFNLGWYLASPVSTGMVATYGAYYGYAYAFSITAVVYSLIAIMFYVCFGRNRFQPVVEE